MIGRSPSPSASTSRRALNANGSVMTVAVGTPARSRVTPSWTLHELQDPQSPKAFTTTLQRLSASNTSGSIGLLAVGLDR